MNISLLITIIVAMLSEDSGGKRTVQFEQDEKPMDIDDTSDSEILQGNLHVCILTSKLCRKTDHHPNSN